MRLHMQATPELLFLFLVNCKTYRSFHFPRCFLAQYGGRANFRAGDTRYGKHSACCLSSAWAEEDGGRCRIRTYDFHRVKVALYR